MSTDNSTYVGPYLQVHGTITNSVPKIRRICKRHPKLENSSNKFCFECASKIIEEDYVEELSVTPKQFIRRSELFEDVFSMPDGLNVMLPNKRCPKHLDVDDDSVVDLTNAAPLIAEHLEWFKKYYSKHIIALSEAFGADNVELKWGVASYWS